MVPSRAEALFMGTQLDTRQPITFYRVIPTLGGDLEDCGPQVF